MNLKKGSNESINFTFIFLKFIVIISPMIVVENRDRQKF